MLYEAYQNKMKRVAATLRRVLRFVPLIIAIAAVLLLAVAALLIAKGSIMSFEGSSSFTYGQSFDFDSSAFLSQAYYEYDDGSGNWTDDAPKLPGSYRVRAVAKTTFGGEKRSAPKSFTIVKRPVELSFASNSFVYGNKPVLTGDLAKGDTVECEFDFTKFSLSISLKGYNTIATPRLDSLRIIDKKGNDVTEAYEITGCGSKNLTVTRRPLLISISDAEKIYDGTPLFSEKYEIKSDQLAEGDSIQIAFTSSITNVGNVKNRPSINIFDAEGKEITSYYSIEIEAGELKINPRPVKIKFGSGTYVYTGLPIKHEEYSIVMDASSMPLLEGHELRTHWVGITNAGEYDNAASAMAVYSETTDVTGNYKFLIEYGKLTIEKYKITVTTASNTFLYDGTVKNGMGAVSLDRALAHPNHVWTFYALNSAKAVDAGVYDDAVTLKIEDSYGIDITKNYEITYNYGTLTIEKRPIHIRSASKTTVYNGLATSAGDVEFVDPDGYKLGVGHYFSTSNRTEITDVGTVENVLEVAIKSYGSGDVTHNYEITLEYGTLTVEPRPVLFVPRTVSKVYDDTPLYAEDSLDISPDSPYPLCQGHTRTEIVKTSGSITDVGLGTSVVESVSLHKIFDKNGVDVTHNYIISYGEGILHVTPRSIYIITDSAEKIYDDTPLTAPGSSTYDPENGKTEINLVEGHEYTLVAYGSLTNAGSTLNIFDHSSFKVIRTSDGRDVTENYAPYITEGTLKVLPRPIMVKTGSASKVYDDTPLQNGEYWVDPTVEGCFDLVEGHKLYLVVIGSQTDAGSSYNHVDERSIRITEGSFSKTENYEIRFDYGTLSVLRRTIIIGTAGAEKVYDDTPLMNRNYFITDDSPYGLVSGHKLSVTVIGERTNAGESPNTCDEDATKITRGGVNVTTNYNIKYNYGTLRVLKRDIIVETGSATKVYDGNPLTNRKYWISESSPYGLVEGHYLYVTVTGSRTDVGIADNICDEGATMIARKSGDGENVTSNYNIKYKYGTLEVTPRPITVYTGSDLKKYDGTPLTNREFGIDESSPYPLVEGQILSVLTTGSRTNIGESPNTCDESATKITEKGRDVTSNYLIEYKLGSLIVVENKEIGGGNEEDPPKPPITDDPIEGGLNTGGEIGGQGNGGGDGDSNDPVHPGDAENSDEVLIKIRTDKTGVLYLKLKSFGGYTGNAWLDAAECPYKISGLYSADYLAGLAIGAPYSKAEIESLKGQYFLPYYMSLYDVSGYDPQSSDVFYDGDASGIYTVYYSTFDYGDVIEVPSNMRDFELKYRAFVYSEYLTIDAETFAYMRKLAEEQGFEGNSLETVKKVAEYIQNAAKYDLGYDTALDSEPNIAIAFLEKYKTGVCRHYATAATLLFRAMGIPARYTVGFMADASAGKWVDVTAKQAHAWVEVYIDGMGWIQLEVTGTSEGGVGGGGGGSGKPELVLTPEYCFKYYDGTPLFAENRLAVDSALKALLDQGYKYDVVITGSRTEVGCGISTIESFTLYDPDGRDVTDEFKIKYNKGVIEILPNETKIIYVTLYQLGKYYDGKPLRFEEGDYFVMSSLSSLKISVELNISLTDVGCLTLSELNQSWRDYAVLNVNGAEPGTEYRIVFRAPTGEEDTYIPIAISARPLTLTAASAEKDYDGKPLEADKYYVSKGSVAPGHSITVDIEGSITSVGTAENYITFVVIKDENGRDVTENYLIETVSGILTVD